MIAELSAGLSDWALLRPAWLWWLLPGLLLVAGWRRRRRLRVRFAATAMLARGDAAGPAVPTSWRSRLRWLPDALEWLGLIGLVVAAARPVHRVPMLAPPPGRDVLLCIDVSSSMAAKDLQPDRDRLQVGCAVATQFVQARPHDRVGVLAFARYPDLRCPLTRDHQALAEVLAGLRMVGKDSPEDATAIGGALARGAAALARSGTAGKVMVVVTDGEENVADALTPGEIAPLHAAQLCAADGIRVHTIRVGRGTQKPDGSFVPLDPTALKQLAAVTGGRHFDAADAAALAAVYAAIEAMEATPEPPPGVREIERFPAVVALALLAVALARGCRVGLRRLL